MPYSKNLREASQFHILSLQLNVVNSSLLLLFHVPYLSTLDDTVTLHISLFIAILVACSYRKLVHSLMLSYQLILGRPLPLSPSMYPSNNVLYTLF